MPDKKKPVFDGAQRLLDIDYANKFIVDHEFPWCRARIFHVLAAAHEQGKLMEVFHEIFDDSVFADMVNDEVFERLITNTLKLWYSGKAKS
jgi:hypothetical protein